MDKGDTAASGQHRFLAKSTGQWISIIIGCGATRSSRNIVTLNRMHTEFNILALAGETPRSAVVVTMTIKRRCGSVLAIPFLLWSATLFSLKTDSLYAESLGPLLVEGKLGLYQRVLTLPGAEFHLSPEISESGSVAIPPFSVYYVYHRKTGSDNASWLLLGFGRYGNIGGWVRQDKTLQWNQGLTLTFRSPANQDRVLLFRDRDSLRQLVANYDLDLYNKLYDAAVNEHNLPDSPVIAIQPDTEIDIRKAFYLLPIRDFEEVFFQDKLAKLLKITSIAVQGSASPNKPDGKQSSNRAYQADIAFVVDATLSMQPYIDRTRRAIQKIYGRLAQNDVLGELRFALVAFQDNPEAVPGLEYLVRTFVTLEQGQNPATFTKNVGSLKTARISSQKFQEDSYAGVQEALDGLNWSPDAAHYIILITDAGPRQPEDPASKSKLDSTTLNKLANEKNVAIVVVHLLTPVEPSDHESASLRYMQLSEYPNIGNLYYAVPSGDIREFGSVVDTVTNQIVNQILQFRTKTKIAAEAPDENPHLSNLRKKITKLGHALRLKYLQSRSNESPPDVFDAWLLDRDFKQPDRPAIDVCVLLSRDQLSDLHGILRQVMQTAEQGLMSPQNFLSELKSLAATVSRDPGQLGNTTATTRGQGRSLAEMGYLREYIEDLPYSGEIMNIKLDDWQSWGTDQQANFLNKLEEKIKYYQTLHDHTDLWISLDGGTIDGNSVYPVPLNMLP